MTKAELENKLRSDMMKRITHMITEELFTDALVVSASEIAVPLLDAEGNEKFALIKVSIPRGTRNGEGGYIPYDGYHAADDYAIDCAEKAQKKADAEAKKQAKIARDQKAREEKKALAEANKNLHELKKIKVTPEKE
jgi:hypothetical protein